MVAAPLLDSSSGWAWTAINLSCSLTAQSSPTTPTALYGEVPMSTSGPTRPEGRYDDRGRRPTPAAVAALVVLVGAFGAWVLWAGLGAATPDIRSDLLAFRITDAGSVRANIEVTADAQRPVTCTVQAQDRNHE